MKAVWLGIVKKVGFPLCPNRVPKIHILTIGVDDGGGGGTTFCYDLNFRGERVEANSNFRGKRVQNKSEFAGRGSNFPDSAASLDFLMEKQYFMWTCLLLLGVDFSNVPMLQPSKATKASLYSPDVAGRDLHNHGRRQH